MIWASKEHYFSRVKKIDLPKLLRYYILEIYDHYHYHDYTKESIEQEVISLLEEDKVYFNNSVYYALIGYADHTIQGAIRLTYWDKKMELPIEKLFGINKKDLLLPGIENFWHIGRFVISGKISRDRISILKKTLFNAFYPVAKMGAGVIIAECDMKVATTLKKLGIEIFLMGDSIEYICSETVPLYIKSEWLNGFIHCNTERYLSKENIEDVQFLTPIAAHYKSEVMSLNIESKLCYSR